VHGLFNLPEPRAALLAAFGRQSNALDRNIVIETALQEIAHELERSLAIKALAQFAGVAAD
jgi:cobyric acid synthase